MKSCSIALSVAVVVWVPLAFAAADPPPGAASCSGCHAARRTTSPIVPRIHGRDADDIMAAMAAFRDATRPSTVMNRVAKGFSDDEIRQIAVWLAGQK